MAIQLNEATACEALQQMLDLLNQEDTLDVSFFALRFTLLTPELLEVKILEYIILGCSICLYVYSPLYICIFMYALSPQYIYVILLLISQV